MKLKFSLVALFVFSALSVFSIVARGQGIITGSISGTAVDQSDAVIPNAEVSAVDKAKGAIFKTESDASGNFALRDLPTGDYDITLTASGFQELKVSGVSITAGSDKSLGRQMLSIGASSTVSVEGESTVALDTTQSQVAASFPTQQLESLPLNNGFDEVALLTPTLLTAFGLQFRDAAEAIRRSTEAMRLVTEGENSHVTYGGFSEDGPGATVMSGRAYTVGSAIYVPRTQLGDKVMAARDYLFEINNAVRQPRFAAVSESARQGNLTADQFAGVAPLFLAVRT